MKSKRLTTNAAAWLSSVVRDIRHAVRALRSSPGFSIAVVSMLALGIGSSTAIFSLISAVMLQPLPFAEPGRLVVLWENFEARGFSASVEPTPATYVEWKDRARSFEGMAMLARKDYNITGAAEPQRVTGIRTETNLFSMLGVQPTLGRTFQSDDEGPAAAPVVVISEALWARHFGMDPSVVGRAITLDGLSHTVIGVVPNDFRFPSEDASLWVPAQYAPDELALPASYAYYVVARLMPEVSVDAAQSEMDAISISIANDGPNPDLPSGVTVTKLQDQLSRSARPTFYSLFTAVIVLLVIVCANVANLLLARGGARRRELAVRKAIGAADGRILRQLLTESAVLSAIGAVVGVSLGALSFSYLAGFVPGQLPAGAIPTLDWRVLVFATLLSVSTVMLFGAAPAARGAREDVIGALKKGGSSRVIGDGQLRNALMIGEIALTVVLLTAGGLLIRSYMAVLALDPGFPTENLLVVETPLSQSMYSDGERRRDFYERVVTRVRALPGVSDAGYVNFAPFTFRGGRNFISVEGEPNPNGADFSRFIVANRVASTGYLETLQVPLLSGRRFDERDSPDAPLAVVINEAMVDRFWFDADPLGKRIKLGPVDSNAAWLTVVGVVANIRGLGLESEPEPEFFLAMSQRAGLDLPLAWPRHLVIRTTLDPDRVAPSVREVVAGVDVNQPVASIRSMADLLEAQVSSRDAQSTLVGGFAVVALALSAIGLYGVLSYGVAQRRNEIGLRVALGAKGRDVIASVVGSALALIGTGTVLGLIAALALTRLLRSFLFGVDPIDAPTLVIVVGAIVTAAIAACALPAARAARIDPAIALRSE